MPKTPDIAVLIPCYNEEIAIGSVVTDFVKALPEATIYVYDNNSNDNTIKVAAEAGATVRREPLQGKGNVVRRMFSDINADIYVLVDGDRTYEAAAAKQMIDMLLSNNLDMVTGCRVSQIKAAYRPGHRFGNMALTRIVSSIFGNRIKDMLSGYRVFSKRYVKSFPALSQGFEIETELTVHALELQMPLADIDTKYIDRPPGSVSKLSTISDGIRILRMIIRLVKEERPLAFFSTISVTLILLALYIAFPVFVEYFQTGLVPRFPTAILAASIVIIGILSLFSGMILSSVTKGRRELKRLIYLSYKSPLDSLH